MTDTLTLPLLPARRLARPVPQATPQLQITDHPLRAVGALPLLALAALAILLAPHAPAALAWLVTL